MSLSKHFFHVTRPIQGLSYMFNFLWTKVRIGFFTVYHRWQRWTLKFAEDRIMFAYFVHGPGSIAHQNQSKRVIEQSYALEKTWETLGVLRRTIP